MRSIRWRPGWSASAAPKIASCDRESPGPRKASSTIAEMGRRASGQHAHHRVLGVAGCWDWVSSATSMWSTCQRDSHVALVQIGDQRRRATLASPAVRCARHGRRWSGANGLPSPGRPRHGRAAAPAAPWLPAPDRRRTVQPAPLTKATTGGSIVVSVINELRTSASRTLIARPGGRCRGGPDGVRAGRRAHQASSASFPRRADDFSTDPNLAQPSLRAGLTRMRPRPGEMVG